MSDDLPATVHLGLTKPLRVEGRSPVGNVGHLDWTEVLLCKDCLRVLIDVNHSYTDDDGQLCWSLRKDARSRPLCPARLCPFCGHTVFLGQEDNTNRWSVEVATARWHSTAGCLHPWTWGTGFWEVRDFDQVMLRAQRRKDAPLASP